MICWLHQRGIGPGTPPWFVPGCERCEAKADAGKVSRDAGPPKAQLTAIAAVYVDTYREYVARAHPGQPENMRLAPTLARNMWAAIAPMVEEAMRKKKAKT